MEDTEKTELDILFDEFYAKIGKLADGLENVAVVVTKFENGKILGGLKGRADIISKLICQLLFQKQEIFESFMNLCAREELVENFVASIIMENPDLLQRLLTKLSGGNMIAVPINADSKKVSEMVEQQIEKLKMVQKYGKQVGEA